MLTVQGTTLQTSGEFNTRETLSIAPGQSVVSLATMGRATWYGRHHDFFVHGNG